MRMQLAVSAAVLAVGVAACTDQPLPTSQSAAPVAAAPVFAISDGARSGGNPDFFFLPPLQPSPRKNPNFDRGGFNPNLSPAVKICDGRDLTPEGECAHPLMKNGHPVVFKAVRGWDGLPDWVDPEQYHVLWQTRDYNLVLGSAYRILVKVGSTLLGYLDIVPANKLLGALRISAGGQDVGWLDDWIVPIRFRIEQGALCADHADRADCAEFPAVTATGGNFTLPSGYAGVAVPPGAIAAGDIVTIVIEKQAPPFSEGSECLPTDLVQSKGCYHFRTEPPLYQFHVDVRMEACVDVQGLDEAQVEALRLFKYNTTQGLVELPQATPTLIDCTNFIALANPAASPPTSFAAAALRRLSHFAERLLSPPPLYASMPGGVPTGLGGMGGSFSDVGGAVPAVEGSPDLTIDGSLSWPEAPQYGSTFNVKVKNIGQASTGPTPFYVGLVLYRVVGDLPDSLGAVWSLVSIPLLPGETRTIQLTIPCSWYSVFGYYFVKAVADFTLIVDDPNRENNTMQSPELQLGSAGSGYCGS